MTSTDSWTTTQVLDAQIEELQLRAKTMIELLKRDALAASNDFRHVANGITIEELTNHQPNMHTVLTVLSWQSRLDEIHRQYTALTKIRNSLS